MLHTATDWETEAQKLTRDQAQAAWQQDLCHRHPGTCPSAPTLPPLSPTVLGSPLQFGKKLSHSAIFKQNVRTSDNGLIIITGP